MPDRDEGGGGKRKKRWQALCISSDSLSLNHDVQSWNRRLLPGQVQYPHWKAAKAVAGCTNISGEPQSFGCACARTGGRTIWWGCACNRKAASSCWSPGFSPNSEFAFAEHAKADDTDFHDKARRQMSTV